MISLLVRIAAWAFRLKLSLIGSLGGREERRHRPEFDTNYPFF